MVNPDQSKNFNLKSIYLDNKDATYPENEFPVNLTEWYNKYNELQSQTDKNWISKTKYYKFNEKYI